MDNPIQVDLGRIAQDLQIRRVQVESVVQLLDEGNTVPFITRYRKERTGNLNEVVIHEIQVRVQRLRELADRKETILKAIDGQGKLTPDLTAAIRAADNPKRLEDLYLPFKPKKRTKASDARERGLEPLAFRIWTRDETLQDLHAAASEFINAEKGVDTVDKVLEGVGHILAEAISEMAMVRDAVRKVVWKTGKIVTAKAEMPEGQGLEYRNYFDYSEPIAQIPPHRVLAINRGDKEGPLKVRLDVSRPEVESVLFSQLPLDGHPHADLFRAAAIDALDRLILPSMEREVRRDLTEAAEKHAVEVFARNLGNLLLQPPISKQVVLAIDPGFRTGCKVAVLDPGGNLLDQVVIFPHPPQGRRSEAKVVIKDLVGKHKVGAVAIGNGTACRETEEFIAEIIAEGTRFSQEGSIPTPDGAEAPPEVAATHSPIVASVDDTPAMPATMDADDGDLAQAAAPVEPVAHPLVEAGSGEDALGNGSGSEAHSEAESHSSSPVEATIEALPPISGGAPDSDFFKGLPPISGGAPDSDVASEGGTAQEAPPSTESISTSVPEGAAHQGFGDEGPAPSATGEHAPTGDHLPVPSEGDTAPSVIEPIAAPVASAVSEPEAVASPSQSESPSATGDHLPAPTEGSAESPAEAEISRDCCPRKRPRWHHPSRTRPLRLRLRSRAARPRPLRLSRRRHPREAGLRDRVEAVRGNRNPRATDSLDPSSRPRRHRPRRPHSRTRRMPWSPSSPTLSSTRREPASTRPARPVATSSPSSMPPSGAAFRSGGASRIPCPNWSRSNRRASASDSISMMSIPSNSRRRSSQSSRAASTSSAST